MQSQMHVSQHSISLLAGDERQEVWTQDFLSNLYPNLLSFSLSPSLLLLRHFFFVCLSCDAADDGFCWSWVCVLTSPPPEILIQQIHIQVTSSSGTLQKDAPDMGDLPRESVFFLLLLLLLSLLLSPSSAFSILV